MNRRFLVILIAAFVTLRCYPQNAGNDDRLREIVRQYGEAIVTVPQTDITSLDTLTRYVSILSVHDKIVKISLSKLTVEWFILRKYNYLIIEKPESKGLKSALNINQAMEWDEYPTYTQYDSIMQNFKTLYPALCRLDTIGTSIKGKLVLALKISDNPGTDGDKPAVFYTSTMHGNEPGGYVMLLRFIDYFLENYNIDSRVKNLVDNLDIWINPLANPDGTYYDDGNTITSPIRYNENGIDLNRNFPDPVSTTTPEQKETIDMIRFLRKHRFVISANFHTGNEVVNYPWDRWPSLHADNDWFYDISRKFADTSHLYSVSGYMTDLNNGITDGYQWYPVYGGRQDFVTYSLQGREVTIELDDESVTPAAQLPLLWDYNWHSLIGYLENALYGIYGQVLNDSSSAPVPAKVFISGHDMDSSEVYADTLTGRFVRFLEPGTWNLTFSAKGYKDTTVNNITVQSGQQTGITVKMSPIINQVEKIFQGETSIYPNPARSEINAVLPGGITGIINIRIFNISGKLMADYNTEVIPDAAILIDVNRLSEGLYSVVFSNITTKTSFSGRFVVIK